MSELVIVRNPDPDSRLPYLIRLPLGATGLVLRTGGVWPREKAIYCYPAGPDEWPAQPELVERVPVRSCVRRGAAIDLVLDRNRENRSQIVFTTARGQEAIFWQTARVRKQARPSVRTPTARASGVSALPIIVDSGERYGYRFARQQVEIVKRRLVVGDYAIEIGDHIRATVERKSLADFVSSMINTRLKYQLTELSTVPHAAVVVEERYSQIFKLEYVRPAIVADGIAELQIAFPGVPIVFCETRQLAEEWTYRFLAAAYAAYAAYADCAVADLAPVPPAPMLQNQKPTTMDVRRWARENHFTVPDRGRLRPEIWLAYENAHRCGDVGRGEVKPG